MNIVMLGAPGTGKGTVAKVLAKRLGMPHISTGDMFREQIKNGTELGKEANDYISKGLLVPDELTIRIVKDRLSQPDTENGVILLDSVCMKLIAVGESVKNLDKITDKELLVNYPAVNWKDVMGMRDIIVHHYFDVDPDVVLQTLREDIPLLLGVLKDIESDL